jgi:hypothetical protein
MAQFKIAVYFEARVANCGPFHFTSTFLLLPPEAIPIFHFPDNYKLHPEKYP